jgi:hypothetical protein
LSVDAARREAVFALRANTLWRRHHESLARRRLSAHHRRMDLPGTTLARMVRMNERPRSPATPSAPGLRAAPPPAPVEDEKRRDEAPEELDKYDVSTLACTD